MNIQVPKGTRDLTGAEALAFTELETVAREAFKRFDRGKIFFG